MRCLAALALLTSPAFAGDVCHEIGAGEGWHAADFPPGMVQEVRSSGFWAVAPAMAPAGTQGHGGLDAKALADRADTRPFPGAHHGALLVRFQAGGKAQVMDWARFHGAIRQSGVFNMNIDQIAFRINEADGALADNTGALTVCFRYID